MNSDWSMDTGSALVATIIVISALVGFICVVNLCGSNDSRSDRLILPYTLRLSTGTVDSDDSYREGLDIMEAGTIT
jgi:hypothetical protein